MRFAGSYPCPDEAATRCGRPAASLRQIFDWYVAGHSAQWIATESNRRGVASPGAAWNRSTRRRGGWHPSEIAGSADRGIGVLNNEAYVGRDIWNWTKWIKDPDTGKRRCVQRPRTEWIVRQDESPRIVPQGTWDAAKQRQRQRQKDVGDRVKKGLAHGVGRAPRYAFSTLVKCEICGSNFVMENQRVHLQRIRQRSNLHERHPRPT